MTYSTQSHSDIARQNAEEYKDAPQLEPDAIVRCIEVFVDNAEMPNYVLFDGELVYANKPKTSGVMQIFGDGGPILITVNREPLLNKMKYWSLPEIKFTSIEEKFKELEERVKALKAFA
jgi:hypothetical protein